MERDILVQELQYYFEQGQAVSIGTGGFEIYRDLREKTGIPLKMYQMDLEALQQSEAPVLQLPGLVSSGIRPAKISS